MQLIACTVQVQDIEGLAIDVQTRQPALSSALPQPPSQALWKNWTWPQPLPNASATDSRAFAVCPVVRFVPGPLPSLNNLRPRQWLRRSGSL